MKFKFSASPVRVEPLPESWFMCEMEFTLWVWKWRKFRKHIANYNVDCVESLGKLEKTFTISGTGKEIMRMQGAWISCV